MGLKKDDVFLTTLFKSSKIWNLETAVLLFWEEILLLSPKILVLLGKLLIAIGIYLLAVSVYMKN